MKRRPCWYSWGRWIFFLCINFLLLWRINLHNHWPCITYNAKHYAFLGNCPPIPPLSQRWHDSRKPRNDKNGSVLPKQLLLFLVPSAVTCGWPSSLFPQSTQPLCLGRWHLRKLSDALWEVVSLVTKTKSARKKKCILLIGLTTCCY